MPGTYIAGIKRVPVEDVLYLFYCPCYSERGNSSDCMNAGMRSVPMMITLHYAGQ